METSFNIDYSVVVTLGQVVFALVALIQGIANFRRRRWKKSFLWFAMLFGLALMTKAMIFDYNPNPVAIEPGVGSGRDLFNWMAMGCGLAAIAMLVRMDWDLLALFICAGIGFYLFGYIAFLPV